MTDDISIDGASIPANGLAAAYAEHRAQLLRYLVARTRDPAEAEDILQDLWLRIGEAPSGPVASPLAYLHRAASNLLLDRVRASQRRARRDADWVDANTHSMGGETVDDSPSAEAVIDGRRRAAQLAAAIAKLPDGAGRVFRRHKIDGASHGEIAAELGITKSAVEKHMAVALRHLISSLRTAVDEKP